MDPAVPSERKCDWGMMTRGLAVPSETVAMDPKGYYGLCSPTYHWGAPPYVYEPSKMWGLSQQQTE